MTRKVVLAGLIVALVSLMTIPSTLAATSTRIQAFPVGTDKIEVIGNGFPVKATVALLVTFGGKSFNGRSQSGSDGRFAGLLALPTGTSGNVSIAATSGTVKATTTVAAKSPPGAPGKLVFNGDFETGNASQYNTCQTMTYNSACKNMPPSYSLSVVPGNGGKVGRLEVHDGDMPFCCGERSQLVAYDTFETEGKDLTYDFSLMIDKQYPITDAWQVLVQWHSNIDGSPPLSFNTWGNNLLLETHPYPNGPWDGVTDIWKAPIVKGQWMNFRIHVKWSTDPHKGMVELWKNGTQQTFVATPPVNGNGVSCTGKTVCNFSNIYKGDEGNRLMITYYRDQIVQGPGIVYFDNVKVYQK